MIFIDQGIGGAGALVVFAQLLLLRGRAERDAASVGGFLIAGGLRDLDVIALILGPLGRGRDADADARTRNQGTGGLPTFEVFDQEGGVRIVRPRPLGVVLGTVFPTNRDGNGAAVVGNGVRRLVCASREVSGQISSSGASGGGVDNGFSRSRQ